MVKHWIFRTLMVMGLFGLIASQANGQDWSMGQNSVDESPRWLPTGPYQPTGEGFYTGIEFFFMNSGRNVGNQLLARRGFVISGNAGPGTVLPSGPLTFALDTGGFGRTSWAPGQKMTLGYRTEDGMTFDVSWLHMYETRYSAAATLAPPDFRGPGNLENTFLYSPVFNFTIDFFGPANRAAGLDGQLWGIWNGASQMDIQFSTRYDQIDLTARLPVYESEDARTYAIAGGRYSFIYETFRWRTVAADNTGAITSADVAIYTNSLSQRMYGPMVGIGSDVHLGEGFGLGIEITGSPLLNLIKERAKYKREDNFAQNKRSWANYSIVPNVNFEPRLTWTPTFARGVVMKLGYNAYTFFNTKYMEAPVGFNFGAIDPAYETKVFRLIHGWNVSLGFVW